MGAGGKSPSSLRLRKRSPTPAPLIIARLWQHKMDRSSEERTLRQVNGRTRLDVNLSEPRAQFKSLATRLELYTNSTDDTFEAMAANYTPGIEALEDEVEALSNSLRAAGQTITTLQEFDLVFYDDLRN